MATESTVRVDTCAYGAFSNAIEVVERYVRSTSAWGRFEAFVAPVVAVTLVEDYTDSVRRHEALECRWTPRFGFLPKARVLLTVRPHAPQGAKLQLSLAYAPPFGRAGHVFDRVAGRAIAYLTARVILHRVKAEVERQHREVRRGAL